MSVSVCLIVMQEEYPVVLRARVTVIAEVCNRTDGEDISFGTHTVNVPALSLTLHNLWPYSIL